MHIIKFLTIGSLKFLPVTFIKQNSLLLSCRITFAPTGMRHLVEIKVDNLATNTDQRAFFSLVDRLKIIIRYMLLHCPLKNSIGGDFIKRLKISDPPN